MEKSLDHKFAHPSLLVLGFAIQGILFLTLGCNDTSKRDIHPSDPTLGLQIFHASDLETYALSEAQCDPTSQIPDVIQTLELYRWQDGILDRGTLDLSTLGIHTTPIASNAVSGVYMDGVFRRSCDSDIAAPPRCALPSNNAVGWRQVSSGTPLKACRSAMAPARDSLEHLALSAIAAIESASLALKPLLPPDTVIPAIAVMVTPRFESLWLPWIMNGKNVTYEQVLGDNLAYFPPTSETPPYIALLPKRKSSSETLRLWESSFVISHEFGHHIERSLALDHFDEQRSHMRIAASEGFADIMAYASLGMSSRALKGIPCIGADRSPELPEFNTGMAKIISKSLLTRLSDASGMMFQEFETMENCQGTLPHSPHGLGAIFAHWILQFSTYTPAHERSPSTALANLAVGWLKQVNQRMAAGGGSPENELAEIARAFEASVTQQFTAPDHPLTENVRALLREKLIFAFPTLKNLTWFTEVPL